MVVHLMLTQVIHLVLACRQVRGAQRCRLPCGEGELHPLAIEVAAGVDLENHLYPVWRHGDGVYLEGFVRRQEPIPTHGRFAYRRNGVRVGCLGRNMANPERRPSNPSRAGNRRNRAGLRMGSLGLVWLRGGL